MLFNLLTVLMLFLLTWFWAPTPPIRLIGFIVEGIMLVLLIAPMAFGGRPGPWW